MAEWENSSDHDHPSHPSEDSSTPLLVNGQPDSLRKPNIVAVIQIGISFAFLFTAYNTIQNFESTLNKNLGLQSLATLYFCFAFSNFFANTVVKKLGERISLTLGGFCYVSFLAAHLYPQPYTLIPTAALLGFGAAILWTAQGSYLAKNSDDATLGFHSGVFFGLFFVNAIVGNLMAAIFINILGEGTFFLVSVLFGIGIVATLSFLLLRKAPSVGKIEESNSVSITQTLMLFKEPKMLFMVPVLVYSGFSQSYFTSRITQRMGEGLIGYVMCSFGVSDTIGSLVMGRLSDKIGRKPVLLFSSLVGLVGYSLAFFVDKSRPWLFFVILVCLGWSDAGYNTQLQATLGFFQPNKLEATYSFLKLIQSSSSGIAFLYTLYFELDGITIIAIVALFTAITSFIVCDLVVAKTDAPKSK